MTPEQLKYSILKAAYEGRLTNRFVINSEIKCAEDKNGNAVIEIENIEKPFDIPYEWSWTTIGKCGKLYSGYAFQSTSYSASGIQVVRISDLENDKISNNNAVYYKEDINLSSFEIQPNSILICMTGSIGKLAYVKDNVKRYLNQRVGMFIPNGSCNTLYLWYYFHTYYVLNKWLSSKTSTNGNIKNSDITDLLIPIPSLDEQNRIVAKIEELLPLVDQYNDAWNKLETFNTKFPNDMKKSILQSAIQGKIVEQRSKEGTGEELFRIIQEKKHELIKEGVIKKKEDKLSNDEINTFFDIPSSWKWVRLDEIGELSRGRSKHRPRNDPKLFIDGKYPFVQTGDVANSNLKIKTCKTSYNELGLQQSRLWPKGTVCLTIAANIGDVAMLDMDACFPDSVVGFNSYYSNITNKFIMYALICYKEIFDGLSHSTAQKNINLDIISKVYFPLPPLEEQKRIVEKIEELLPLCKRLQKKEA